jgi:hypothetical protein
MPIKIRGGTARCGEPPLCATCRYATIVRGASLRDEIVECSQLSYDHNRVTFSVVFCTRYADRRQPSIRDMEEVAWVLRSDPKRKAIGFVPSASLRPRDRWRLSDDDV